MKAVFQVVQKKVNIIKEEEEREDLKLLGRRYATMLEQELASQISNEAFKGEPEKKTAKPAPVKKEPPAKKKEVDMDVDDPPKSNRAEKSPRAQAEVTCVYVCVCENYLHLN